eukprot:gnl/Ergobibamus_cyprinoides/190.p1 GENE.gnl/Ergobibamus_cyprinoides/190~~gnl/Ergobibamus_cyprinoides/190.p1  ORF type:complete len:420 (+),score=145.95 gnl/Ergobibamus_cyprinoides/190:116-1261(+)
MVFTRTKKEAHRLAIILGLLDISSRELHGNLTQSQRTAALADFAAGGIRVIVCTDVAARGIDVDCIQCVVNLELPREADTYIHRSGRTARAGRAGTVVTLVDESERGAAKKMLRSISSRAGPPVMRQVPQEVLDQCVTMIADSERDVKAVLASEAAEKEIRLATATIDRAEELIAANTTLPGENARQKLRAQKRDSKAGQREWFQSKAEREAMRTLSRRVALGKQSADSAMAEAGYATKGGKSGESKLQEKLRQAAQRRDAQRSKGAKSQLDAGMLATIRKVKRVERQASQSFIGRRQALSISNELTGTKSRVGRKQERREKSAKRVEAAAERKRAAAESGAPASELETMRKAAARFVSSKSVSAKRAHKSFKSQKRYRRS